MTRPQPKELQHTSEGALLLKTFPLFSNLEPSELEIIAEQMTQKTAEVGERLLTQNEPAQAVYFLKKGAVRILINGEMVAQVDTVQCFGEMSCLTPETPASATVETAQISQLLVIPKDKFVAAVDQIPKLWKTLFFQMSGRFKKSNMRMSEVLEHTPQGLMRIDKQGNITNEYSIHCTQYFGKDDLSGLSFPALVLGEKQDELPTWMETFHMLFDSDAALPFEDIVGLLTKEFKKQDGEIGEYVLSYYPCREIDGSVVAIDVGVEDVTEARALERANQQMRAEQEVMGKIYENPEAFLNMRKFMVDTLKGAKDLANALAQPSGELPAHFKTTMRLLHSLKGFSGMFLLRGIQTESHHLETIVREIEEAGISKINFESRKRFVLGLVDLKVEFQKMEGLLDQAGESLKKRLLGVAFAQADFALLKQAVVANDLETARKIIDSAEAVDAKKLFSGWITEADRLAERTNKIVAINVSGSGGSIPKALYSNLEQVLPHILRNSLDHGIETPEKREALGKSEDGHINIKVDVEDQVLKICVEDDGRGIDIDGLPEVARQKKGLNQEIVESLIKTKEVWKILFLPGFSTAQEVTEISGRGVGLDAVMDIVSSNQGEITIETEPGAKTALLMTIPLRSN